MRQWVTRRALLLHLAFLAIGAGCLTAAWWQVHRAMQGNTLSYFYSIEWPAFVVVAGIGWWQMVHDTPDDIEQRRQFRAQMRAASAEVVARTLPRSALAISADSKETGRRALTGALLPNALGGAHEHGPGVAIPSGGTPGLSVPGPDEVAVDADTDAGTGAGPLLQASEDEMTGYNRYLALLAVKGKAKTWRNPRGH